MRIEPLTREDKFTDLDLYLHAEHAPDFFGRTSKSIVFQDKWANLKAVMWFFLRDVEDATFTIVQR